MNKSERESDTNRNIQNLSKIKKRKRQVHVMRCKVLLGVLAMVGLLVIASVKIRINSPVHREMELSKACESYRPQVVEAAGRYQMSEYVELIMAVMMQESSGSLPDVMQSAEGKYNTKYPQEPNGITDPQYSIECGIQELKYALELAECKTPRDMEKIRLALQAYNFGADGFLAFVKGSGEESWQEETVEAYAQKASGGKQRSESDAKARGRWSYGDQFYPDHVLRYYPF